MSNRNKQKGKAFEREIAKHLSDVFKLGFRRLPNSGSLTGGKNAFRRETMSEEHQLLSDGDIICPIELSHIQLECKFYKEFSFRALYTNNEQLNKWVSQASENQYKYWFLLMKFNNVGRFIAYDPRQFLKHSNVVLEIPGNSTLYGDLVFTRLDDFFEVNKETILNLKKIEQV